jgi:hypothetical protein
VLRSPYLEGNVEIEASHGQIGFLRPMGAWLRASGVPLTCMRGLVALREVLPRMKEYPRSTDYERAWAQASRQVAIVARVSRGSIMASV